MSESDLQHCPECGHDEGWLGSTSKTCQKPLVDKFPGIQICGHRCTFPVSATEAGEGINSGSLRILDAGHGRKGTFFTVVHDGQHAFVHYQLPQGFIAFQGVDDATGMIINNYLADVYEKEDTKHGRTNADNSLAPQRRANH